MNIVKKMVAVVTWMVQEIRLHHLVQLHVQVCDQKIFMITELSTTHNVILFEVMILIWMK